VPSSRSPGVGVQFLNRPTPGFVVGVRGTDSSTSIVVSSIGVPVRLPRLLLLRSRLPGVGVRLGLLMRLGYAPGVRGEGHSTLVDDSIKGHAADVVRQLVLRASPLRGGGVRLVPFPRPTEVGVWIAARPSLAVVVGVPGPGDTTLVAGHVDFFVRQLVLRYSPLLGGGVLLVPFSWVADAGVWLRRPGLAFVVGVQGPGDSTSGVVVSAESFVVGVTGRVMLLLRPRLLGVCLGSKL